MQKKLLTGMLLLLLIGAASFAGTVVAQESDEEEKVRDHTRSKTFALGIGAAIETDDDHPYRSHFRLAIAKVAPEDTEYEVKRGVVVINDEGSPVRYHVIPETWEINVREDNSAFTAEGTVEDIDGNTFEVSLDGNVLRELEHGWLYIVNGTFEGGDEEYELYYISAVIKRPAVKPTDAVRE
ncbi:MAG: hypothetical protein ACE5J2_07825 [Nitrososphaerales archaeon]